MINDHTIRHFHPKILSFQQKFNSAMSLATRYLYLDEKESDEDQSFNEDELDELNDFELKLAIFNEYNSIMNMSDLVICVVNKSQPICHKLGYQNIYDLFDVNNTFYTNEGIMIWNIEFKQLIYERFELLTKLQFFYLMCADEL